MNGDVSVAEFVDGLVDNQRNTFHDSSFLWVHTFEYLKGTQNINSVFFVVSI